MIHNLGVSTAKFQTVTPPSGFEGLGGLIAFLSNKKEVEKYFNELAHLIDTANEAIAKVGKADQIDKLLADAELKDRTAADAMTLFKEKGAKVLHEAEATLSEAKTKAAKLVNDAKIAAENRLQDADERNQAIVNKEKELKDREDVILANEGATQAKLANAEKRDQSLSKKEAEIDRKMKILGQL